MNMAMIDRDAILAPIAGDGPAGAYLYYEPVYDEIRQARRAADPACAGEGEAKESEWDRVVSLCHSVLSERSKDLLLGAWLSEALAIREGFAGLGLGLCILEGLVEQFWDHVHPLVEDDDHDGRAAPFEFLNDKVSIWVKQIPLTDPKATPGYGLSRYLESRKVGYEADGKPDLREEALAEGKISAEQFDLAVNRSPVSFYRALADAVSESLEQFRKLDGTVDRNFGRHAPSLSELGQTLEECQHLVLKICREQKGLKDQLEGAALAAQPAAETPAGPVAADSAPAGPTAPALQAAQPGRAAGFPAVAPHADADETLIWDQALRVMHDGGFRKALDLLLAAATSQPSERGRYRYRFLVARLCLKAGHPELARPIVEQLNTMVTELQLEKWESPFWISEILEALYQCLTTGEEVDDDAARAKELFRKICTLDVTKALK
jgi:type VI secretion system protein ImpA